MGGVKPALPTFKENTMEKRFVEANHEDEKLVIRITLVSPELTPEELQERIDRITDDVFQHAVLPRFWSKEIKST
jgi:hypothetical protein